MCGLSDGLVDGLSAWLFGCCCGWWGGCGGGVGVGVCGCGWASVCVCVCAATAVALADAAIADAPTADVPTAEPVVESSTAAAARVARETAEVEAAGAP